MLDDESVMRYAEERPVSDYLPRCAWTTCCYSPSILRCHRRCFFFGISARTVWHMDGVARVPLLWGMSCVVLIVDLLVWWFSEFATYPSPTLSETSKPITSVHGQLINYVISYPSDIITEFIFRIIGSLWMPCDIGWQACLYSEYNNCGLWFFKLK